MKLFSPIARACLGLTVVLAGCASVDEQRASLAGARPCCADADATSIEPMRSAKLKVTIAERDPVGIFSSGNSRYRILDLSSLPSRPLLLSIRSVGTATNVYAAGKSWAPVLYPAVTFLDQEKRTLSTVSEDRPANPSLSCKALLHCGFAIVTVDVPGNARFAVLHTPNRKIGETRQEALPGQAPDQTYSIGGSLVTIPGGGSPALRTIGMSVGELEVHALAEK